MSLKKLLTKAALFLGSCLLSIAIFETAIRVVSARKNIYTIEMVKYAKTLKTRDPLGVLTHVHRPNSHAHLMGVDISLNSLGHRNAELLERKPTSSNRIFILGSSITMGWGVDAKDVFTERLGQKLAANEPGKMVEIANAGTGNYNTFCQFEIFRRQLDTVNPDSIVLHYFINDAEPNPENSNPLARYSFLAAYLNSELQAMYFRYVNKRNLADYYSDLYTTQSQDWKNTLGYVTQMHRTAKERKIPFLVMLIPDTHDLRPESPYAPIYSVIQSHFEEAGVPTLNTFGAFSEAFGGKEKTLWVQADDPHPNALGHELMADLLYSHYVPKRQNVPRALGNSDASVF